MGKILKAFALLSLLALAACSSSSGGSSGNNDRANQQDNFVNWSTVSAEFNPKVEDNPFRTYDIDRIKLNIFDPHQVEVIYSPEFRAGEANLRIFKVWKNQASWGRLQTNTNGRNLELNNFGQYQCSIQVTNGTITSLDGGCYVKAQIFLPRDSEIEVYFLNQLITKRFIPIDNASFLRELASQYRDEQRLAMIDNYISSYTGTRVPSLTSNELGLVIREFSFSESKLEALNRLHLYVSDRQNLEPMIKDRFNYFDQEKARQIVNRR